MKKFEQQNEKMTRHTVQLQQKAIEHSDLLRRSRQLKTLVHDLQVDYKQLLAHVNMLHAKTFPERDEDEDESDILAPMIENGSVI